MVKQLSSHLAKFSIKNMSNRYEEYALIDSQIEALEAKKESLKAEIIADLNARGKATEDHSLGKFTIAKLKRWTYPKNVIEIEKEKKGEIAILTDEIKAAKAKAENTGEATYEEQDSLRFTSIKI